MRIALIGAGMVGGALGRRWAENGHEVLFCTRHPEDDRMSKMLDEIGTLACSGPVEKAASWGDVVVLAIPWAGVTDALHTVGDLKGRVLLDCTNPLAADLSGLGIGHTTSGGEQVAEMAKNARVVKIFNTTGFGNMLDPQYEDHRASMFYCGDDDDAKSTAAGLAEEIGFDPVDAGPLQNSRLLEPLAMLWIYMAMRGGQGREIAFKLMRR